MQTSFIRKQYGYLLISLIALAPNVPLLIMFMSFLSHSAPFFYISWLILLVARIISNYHIYYLIGKEEFQGSQFELSHRYSDDLLAFFTFRWSRSYMEDEDPEVIRLMRISNVLHLVFIVLSVITTVIWLCLHG